MEEEIETIYSILFENDIITAKQILLTSYSLQTVNCLMDILKTTWKNPFTNDLLDTILDKLTYQQILSLKKTSKTWSTDVDNYYTRRKQYFEKLILSDNKTFDKTVVLKSVSKEIQEGNVPMAKYIIGLIAQFTSNEADKDFLLYNLARVAISYNFYTLAEFIVGLHITPDTKELLHEIAYNLVFLKKFKEAIRLTQLLIFPTHHIATILKQIGEIALKYGAEDMDLAIHLVELLNKIIYDSSYDDFYKDRDRKLRNEFLDSLVKRLLHPSSRKPTLEDIQQALRLMCLPAIFHEKNSQSLLYVIARVAIEHNYLEVALQIIKLQVFSEDKCSEILYRIGSKAIKIGDISLALHISNSYNLLSKHRSMLMNQISDNEK